MPRELVSGGDAQFAEHSRFYNTFVKQDLTELEHELFPAFDLHIGELHPAIGKRLQQLRLSELRQMERRVEGPDSDCE